MAFLYKGDTGDGLHNFSFMFSPVQGKGQDRDADFTGVLDKHSPVFLCFKEIRLKTHFFFFFPIYSSQINQNRIFQISVFMSALFLS